MITIELPRADATLRSLFRRARKENVFLRTPKEGEFVLVALDDFDVEIAKTRRNKPLMRVLEKRARQKTVIPLPQVRRRLGLGP